MEQVSPSLSASSKLLQLCAIQRQAQIPPTFDYDKAELAAADRNALEEIATCLVSGPGKGKKLVMVGRADPRGTQEYNLGLGAHRARNVSTYLQRLGVQPVQLAENTRGDLEATGTDEDTWRQDRRVDLDVE